MSRGPRRFWIVSTLLGVAACAPFASLPAFSQPRATAPAPLSQSNLSGFNLSESNLSESNPVAVEMPQMAIDSNSERIVSCSSSYPVFCIYLNRNLVSHLEKEVWATSDSTAPQPDLEENVEPSNPPRRPTTAALGRKIRLLTQLKTWLDALS